MVRTTKLLLASLLAATSLAGCGAGEHAPSADIVTTGPEPGAEIASVTTPTAEAPTAPTTPATPGATTRAKATPTATATTVPSATAKALPEAEGARSVSTPEPTIAPAATRKPLASTDEVDLAFSRQMINPLLVSKLYVDEASKRGQHAALRDLADTYKERHSDDLGHMQAWGDAVDLEPGSAYRPANYRKDIRALGITKAQLEPARKVLGLTDLVLADVPDDRFDEAVVTALIEEHETSIIITTATVKTSGSALFRRYAARLTRTLRSEIKELRALELD